MRHHYGSDASVDSLDLSNGSEDSICRCDTHTHSQSQSQSSLATSNCKIGFDSSHIHIHQDHNDTLPHDLYSPSGSGKLLCTKDSLEKVSATLRNRRISSGGSDTTKWRKDECARDRKVKKSWPGIDTSAQVKNTIQEYHCTKKDGASTYTCVIVKKFDLPKPPLKSEESKGSNDYCSYNMKGNEAPGRPQDATPTAITSQKEPLKETNQVLESKASNTKRIKKELCTKCSMQTACSQHTTKTEQSPLVTKSSICSRGSLCSGNSLDSAKSSEKENSKVGLKRSYFSWVSSALKNINDESAEKSKSSIRPTELQSGKPEFSKRSSVSVCKSDSIKSICITESTRVTEVIKDVPAPVPVQEKGSQTDFRNAKNSNSNSNSRFKSAGLNPDFCPDESRSNVPGKAEKSEKSEKLKLKVSKSSKSKEHVPPSCSKTTIQTSLASCFSRTSSKPNIPAQSQKTTPLLPSSKTCLKKTLSRTENSKSGTNDLGAKSSKIGFRSESRSTKKSVADKASQTDIAKRSKKGAQEDKKARESKSSEESLCSQDSGHTTTLVFQPAPRRSLHSVKSSSSKKSFCSLKRSKSKDKNRHSKKKVSKKSSICSKKSAKSLRTDKKNKEDEGEGEMKGASCSLSCKDSFMAAKNDPEIARTSCSIRSCDIKSKLDDDSSLNYEACLCEDATCDVTMRPSSCRPKKGLLQKLFCRKTREERCIQKREKREKQRRKRKEKERKRREKERERERKEREKERERERKEREKECKRRRKEREKEKKRRAKEREKERKALEKEREKERKRREKEKKEEEKRKAAETSSSDSESSLSC